MYVLSLSHSTFMQVLSLSQSIISENKSVFTFIAEELKLALKHGYKVLSISEVYHYSERKKYCKESGQHGIFSEFIDFFLKLKQQASDYPAWVKEAEDVEVAKRQYVENYEKHEGIKLNPEQIEKNPALRCIAKLLLNSFWVSVLHHCLASLCSSSADSVCWHMCFE